MNIKRIIPNAVKQEGKYLLLYLLKIPFNRAGIPDEIAKFLPNDQPINYVDIGASEGKFAGRIDKHYKIKEAVLIEPLADLRPTIEKAFPDRTHYHIETLVISNSTGNVDFYYSKDASVLSSMLKEINGYFDECLAEPIKISIKADTLDNVMTKYNFDTIDLLKIDVQGTEHLVLQAAAETLKKTRFVYTEFSYKPMYHGSSTFFDLLEIFEKNNFRLVSTKTNWANPDGEMIQGDALFANNA